MLSIIENFVESEKQNNQTSSGAETEKNEEVSDKESDYFEQEVFEEMKQASLESKIHEESKKVETGLLELRNPRKNQKN